jgi:hypothetical protein
VVGLTAEGSPFVHGLCGVCDDPLPAPRRAICDRRSCKSAASALGGRRASARGRRRRKADAAERTCAGPCGRTLPQDRAHFAIRGLRDDGTVRGWDAGCKSCRREAQRARYRERPEYRDAKLRQAVEQRDRIKARMEVDAEFRDAERARGRAYQRDYARRHPERVKAWQAGYRRKVAADPELRRRKRENERIDARLRAERQGRTIRARESVRVRDEAQVAHPPLPARELGEAVEWHITRALSTSWHAETSATRETLAEGLGTTARTVRAWLTGERATVRFDTADAVLTALGLAPFDVWDDPDVLALFGV